MFSILSGFSSFACLNVCVCVCLCGKNVPKVPP